MKNRSKGEELLVTATENSTARTETRASNPILANRLAMAIKRAKGRCEMRYSISEGYESRCLGRPVGPFYSSDNRVRMLCDECWEEQVDYQQRMVSRDKWWARLTP